ncbi:MAG: hypothetical protein LBB38_02430 [Puniceicoccales bacterium]|nr:hypothetical protein [Puniceicoccales bacterium]
MQTADPERGIPLVLRVRLGLRSAMGIESNRRLWKNIAANGNRLSSSRTWISSLGEAYGQSHVKNASHGARNWKTNHGEESAADLPSRPLTFGCGSAFVCNSLHLAILRQLHAMSPLAMSVGQLHAMLRGMGFIVGVKNLSNAVEELERAGRLECRSDAGVQPRYGIVELPWDDGR